VTSPMPSGYDGLGKRVKRMQRAAIERDQRMMVMGLVRQGKPEVLFEDLFSDTWRRPIVANFIQTVAQEQADLLSKLPALSCSVGNMRSDADKRRAAQRNKIGTHYMRQSNLSSFSHAFADNLMTFGFAAMYAEPCYEEQLPLIRTMPSIGTYYQNDRFGNTLALAHCYKESVARLCELFPQHAPLIKTKVDQWGQRTVCADDEKVEVVQWIDDQQWCLFTPDRADLVLTSFPVVTSKCPVRVAELPTIFHEPQGNYDQLVWVQLARHRMALLSLEAGVKAVGAPLAVPRDVNELAVGPDAVMVTDSPEKVRRVALEVPNSAFALSQTLEQELRLGARYPEGRATGMDASVITGQGVHALMGSFDAQIATAQSIIGNALARTLEFCFETDDKVWPHTRKRITGNVNGEPYDLSYTPAKDINGVYTVDVSYGFAAGLSPNAAVVMLLQLRGDGLIDRSTVRRNMPFPIDDEAMQRSMDVEQTADALKQGLGGLLASLGPMAANGMDPRPYLRTAAEIIKGRRNGKDLADLFVDAFSPEVMAGPEAQQQEQAGAEAGAPSAGGSLPGQDPNTGLPTGTVPGQAGQGPGGAPDLQTLIAGLRNQAAARRRVSRRLPTA
jgi:hypothetical protein